MIHDVRRARARASSMLQGQLLLQSREEQEPAGLNRDPVTG